MLPLSPRGSAAADVPPGLLPNGSRRGPGRCFLCSIVPCMLSFAGWSHLDGLPMIPEMIFLAWIVLAWIVLARIVPLARGLH